jgi:hypothetical protein
MFFGAAPIPSGTSCIIARDSGAAANCVTSLSLGNDAAQIYDTSVSSKTILLSPAGASNSVQTTIGVSSTAARTFTLPDRTGTGALTVLETINASAGFSATAAQMSSTILNNYGQTAANVTINMPVAEAGLNFLAIMGTAQNNFWRLNATNGNKIYFDGTAGAANGYVQQATTVVGSYITCLSFQTAANALDYMCKSGAGTWVAGP